MKKMVKFFIVLFLLGLTVQMDATKKKPINPAKSVEKSVDKLKRKSDLKRVHELGKKDLVKQDVKQDIAVRRDTNENELVLGPIQMIMSGGPINTMERVLESIEILLEFGNLTMQEILGILRDAAVDVNLVDQNGCTALHWAAKYGDIRCMEILIGAGINVNAVGVTHRRTALHRAARYAQKECVEMLLRAGAEIDLRDSGNQTALHRAFKGKNKLSELTAGEMELSTVSEFVRSDLINKYNLIIQVLVRHALDSGKAIPADLRPRLHQMGVKC